MAGMSLQGLMVARGNIAPLELLAGNGAAVIDGRDGPFVGQG